MTLEEAKKKIRNYMKQSKDDYNRFEDDICRGEADAYSHALSILEQVDTEPVVKDKLTLTELARELKKIFKFRWLTLDYTGYITLWNKRPKYTAGWKESEKTWQRGNDPLCDMSGYIFPNAVGGALDLEEYADEHGEIDYSKCIVEMDE